MSNVMSIVRACTNLLSIASSLQQVPRTMSGLLPSDSLLGSSPPSEEYPPEIESMTLAERLQGAQYEWPPGQNSYFIPVDVLDELMTYQNVKEELRQMDPKMEEQCLARYANYICTSAKKIFAILLCGQNRCFIFSFVDEGISDKDLPFVRCSLENDCPASRPNHQFILCKRDHSECKREDHRDCGIKALSSRSRDITRDFCRDQWLVQAPVFEKSSTGEIPHHDLDNNVILPFIEDREAQESQTKSGGYSHVWGVRIHSAHQNLYHSADPNVKEPLLAVKRPFSFDYREFKKETDMLSALAARNHKNLVRLLATYKFKSHYHLLFPYANTNLRGYWDDTGLPHCNRETYLWFLHQVSGLVSGLNTIHNFNAGVPLQPEQTGPMLKVPVGNLNEATSEQQFGRHGDIKPENILWTNELGGTSKEGILQIADMGLGRFHRLQSRSKVDPRSVSGSPTYTPPEIALEKPVSRAYDIWCLGCVFLEFVTWLLEGGSSVYQFSSVRAAPGADGITDDTFYTLVIDDNGHRRAVIREGVNSWISRLHQNPRCSPVIKDILLLVQNSLIVIESQDRISAEALNTGLQEVLEKAMNDPVYLLGNEPPVSDSDAGVKIPLGKRTRYASTNAAEEGRNNGALMEVAHDTTYPVIVVEEFRPQRIDVIS